MTLLNMLLIVALCFVIVGAALWAMGNKRGTLLFVGGLAVIVTLLVTGLRP